MSDLFSGDFVFTDVTVERVVGSKKIDLILHLLNIIIVYLV